MAANSLSISAGQPEQPGLPFEGKPQSIVMLPMTSSGTSETSMTASPASATSAAQKLKKASFATRIMRKLSSGSRRKSSDDSTASLASQELTLSLGPNGKLRIPTTIPEQNALTREQLDADLRNQQIEQAASERDEKRKRRVLEALESLTRRFDAANAIINAEMDENVDITRWTAKEMKYIRWIFGCIGFVCVLGCVFPYALFMLVLLPPSILYYSHETLALRHHDAKQASDNVGARLDDLEDGIRRCMLALQHDLEADAEWEASMKEEQQRWEERHRELEMRRGRTLRNLNTKRKKIVEQIRSQATALTHLPHLPDHLPDVAQKARSFLEKKNFRPSRSRTASHTRQSGSDGDGAIIVDAGANPGWIKYVHANLPSERLDHETDEEKEFAMVLRQKTEGRWDMIPSDLQLMVLRGYADKKERLKESVEAIDYIVMWRAHTKADTMLQVASPEFNTFCNAWFSRFGGEDRYGHVIFFDRVQDLDLPVLYNFSDDDLLRHRTQQMEVLRYKKNQTTEVRGQRVCKHIYVMDLAGLSLTKHFTARVKNLLSGIFKVGGDSYPDSLWSLWLINTPMVFQVVWKMLSPTIDSVTKSKIRMVGGKDKYIPEMEKCGIPKASIPKEFGGDFQAFSCYDALLDIMEDEKHRVSNSEQSEQPSAIEVIPDRSSVL